MNFSLVILLMCMHLLHFVQCKCNEQEIFNLSDMEKYIKFHGEATCYRYEKLYTFNPDPNARKGRVLSIVPNAGDRYHPGESYLQFEITEFTTHSNGSIDMNITRRGDIKRRKIWFAPTTGIIVKFKREHGDYSSKYYSFTATITETAVNHNCPFPFLDLQPYVPVVIDETAIIYKCDLLITAPEDYDIRIDHIEGASEHPGTYLRIFNASYEAITSNTTDWSCGPSQYVFNESAALFQSPEYPRSYCNMESCEMTLTLPLEMREKYKMQVGRFYNSIEIRDGPNGITTWNKRMVRPLMCESPVVTLKYHPPPGMVRGGAYSVEVSLVERQRGCDCPHQFNIDNNLYVKIPAYCKNLDCLYLLPLLELNSSDNTAKYHVDRSFMNDITSRTETHDLENFTFGLYTTNETGTWTTKVKERQLIRLNRANPTPHPTILNLSYTTNGEHISHSERCGCFNQTILMRPNQALNFSSPDWPARYCDNLVCVTTFSAPVDHHLEVKLGKVSLEPNNDRVLFFEGTNISASHTEVVTGEVVSSNPISSTGPIITVVFISNGAVAFDGYNGTITAVPVKSSTDNRNFHVSGWWLIATIFSSLLIIGILLLKWKRVESKRTQSTQLMEIR